MADLPFVVSWSDDLLMECLHIKANNNIHSLVASAGTCPMAMEWHKECEHAAVMSLLHSLAI